MTDATRILKGQLAVPESRWIKGQEIVRSIWDTYKVRDDNVEKARQLVASKSGKVLRLVRGRLMPRPRVFLT